MFRTVAQAREYVGGLSNPSKMPGKGYGLPARTHCTVGGKLSLVEGSTCRACYATRGRYIFANVQAAQYRRLATLTRPLWAEAMARAIGRTRWFRWHDSGDVQSYEHLLAIVRVATLRPDVAFWLPTREYALVTRYRLERGAFPANLTVRLSAPMIGQQLPARAGNSSMVLAKGASAPAGVYVCPAKLQAGKCGDCRACWNASNVTTAYPIH